MDTLEDGPCVVTEARPLPWELAALGGYRVTERKLKPSTEEVVKGVLIHAVKNRTQAFERNFPDLAKTGGLVTYDVIDNMTKDQGEYVAYEMASLLGGFAFEERKIKNGYGGRGRPSLLADAPSEDERDLESRSLRIKGKLMERALTDLCDVLGLENPLS